MPDVLNALLGIDEGSPLGQLRAERPEATTHMQGSYDALFVNDSATSLTRPERFATALRTAHHHGEKALIHHYVDQLRDAGGAPLMADIETGPSAPGLT